MRKVIIPAAGFGRRVGSPQAKELLLRPAGSYLAGKPMIDAAITLAQEACAGWHVITREEKVDLIKYLQIKIDCEGPIEMGENLKSTPISRGKIQIVQPTREWPDSILQSEKDWTDFNVVCLPDTDFAPTDIVTQMFQSLEQGAEVVFATHKKADLSTWGVIRYARDIDMSGGGSWLHAEKPIDAVPTDLAWGLFGFRKDFGEKLLQNMLKSTFDHGWYNVVSRPDLFALNHFEDTTRG